MAQNFNPEWFFGNDPGLSSKTKDGLVKLVENVYSLRNTTDNQNAAIATANESITSLNRTVSVIATSLPPGNGSGGNSSNNATPPVIFGSHANRANTSASTFKGFLYVEVDRFQSTYYSNGGMWILVCGVATGSFESRYTALNSTDSGLYWIETSRNNITASVPYPIYQWQVSAWNLLGGQFYRNQSDLATLTGTFSANNSNNGNDVGAVVNVIDYAGQLQWGGSAFAWGPEDSRMHGAGPIPFEVDPANNTGWRLYDGSNNVAYLKQDGTTGTVNLPNLTSANNVAFLEFGNVSSGNAVIPAVSPSLSGATFTGNSNNFTSANILTSVGNTTVLEGPNPVGVSGNVSGNVSNNGQPPSIVRRAWFRQ